MTDVRDVFNAALALTDEQRTILIELLESLPVEEEEFADEEFTEEQFLAELHRRRQELIDGTDKGMAWSEVRNIEKIPDR